MFTPALLCHKLPQLRTRRSSSSTPTPLLLPSLSSVTGSFCHSSSHLVNRCDTFRSLQCISHRMPAQSKAAPPAQHKLPSCRPHGQFCLQEHWTWHPDLPVCWALLTTPFWSLLSSIPFFLICDIIKASVHRNSLAHAALPWLRQIHARQISEPRKGTNKDKRGNSPWTF